MKRIFVEGKSDFPLVRALDIPKKDIQKLGGKGKVCNHIEGISGATGLIDEDPDEIPHKYLQKLRPKELEHDLLIYLDNRKKNKFIALRPRLEEWLIKVCEHAGVKMNDPSNPKYELKLPNRPKELHDFLPQHPEQLEKLVAHLLELKNPALLLLQSHLLEK